MVPINLEFFNFFLKKNMKLELKPDVLQVFQGHGIAATHAGTSKGKKKNIFKNIIHWKGVMTSSD